jgi:arylsulfatase A-like enzyme
LDSQTFSFRDTPLSTASTNWKDVPGLGGIVCAAGEVSASLSVTLAGAPVDVRVQVDKAGAGAHPGQAHLSAASGTSTFSFTWADTVFTKNGSDAHGFAVQWKSSTGQSATLSNGNLTLRFQRGSNGPDCSPAPAGPNVVLILTDDQRWDTLWAMPNVQSLLVDHGVTFDNAFTVNPTCCPSRAGILRGQYSHGTQVYKNTPPFGGFDTFDDSSTVATWLKDAGYRTGLIGKYLNGYNQEGYIPPGWDAWEAFTTDNGNGDYFDYNLSVNGSKVHFGSEDADYSTDVLAADAVSFIDSTPTSAPLFLYFSPKAPHEPSTPPPRYANAFDDLPPWRPPSYNEPNADDKPPYVKDHPPLDPDQQAALDELVRDQYRTLLAVDDAVGAIVGALAGTGRLEDTLIVFASDNGYLWGEHRLTEKDVPYEESIRIPMVVRFDARSPLIRHDPSLVLNIDLAPTFADVAGIPTPAVDGQSLLPLLTNPAAAWRDDFLIEHLRGGVPTFCAVRTEQYLYANYLSGKAFLELYVLADDRFELNNVARVDQFAPVVAALEARRLELCSPPPPANAGPELPE